MAIPGHPYHQVSLKSSLAFHLLSLLLPLMHLSLLPVVATAVLSWSVRFRTISNNRIPALRLSILEYKELLHGIRHTLAPSPMLWPQLRMHHRGVVREWSLSRPRCLRRLCRECVLCRVFDQAISSSLACLNRDLHLRRLEGEGRCWVVTGALGLRRHPRWLHWGI